MLSLNTSFIQYNGDAATFTLDKIGGMARAFQCFIDITSHLHNSVFSSPHVRLQGSKD